MRSLVAFAACSLLATIPACTKEELPSAPPPEKAPTETEKPTDEPKPSDSSLVVLELGEVDVGTDVTFDIPEGVLGFNITAEGRLADFNVARPFGIERITAPDGTIVHDDFMPSGGSLPTSLAVFDAIAAASVPQSENAPANLAGTWKVRFGVQGSTTAKPQLKAAVRVQSTGDGAFHGGQLNVVFHVPEGLQINERTIDATKAADDPSLQERIDIFFELTSELLGIERGEVKYQTEDASFQDLDGEREVLAGFATSKGEKDGTQALHVLLANNIAMDGEPFAQGLAAGIPGAATVFGRSVSGIIVTMTSIPLLDATVLLHETGHFFGLNHTTEMQGPTPDPLSDTPFCENLSRNPDVLTACPDRTNVMFVAGPLEAPVTLSPTQTRVYRGSPIYRALPAGSGGRTMALTRTPPKTSFERTFRISGSAVLSPVERELSLGFCGHNELDANGLVRRHGRDAAIAQLRAASADADLVPFMRGRARLALKSLGIR